MTARRTLDAVSLPPVPAAAPNDVPAMLLAALLHEVRQPLFAIKAHAQLGAHDPTDAARRFGQIVAQTQHLEALIRHYAAALGAGGHEEDAPVVLDLGAAVHEAVEMARPRAASPEGGPRVVIPAGASPRVRIRRVALRQILGNLLGNALDALRGLPSPQITLAIEPGPRWTRVVIEDNGPGVPAEHVATLFEPFRTSKAPGEGTGLGLYIARRLATEADGTLTYEPVARGARFALTLPTWPA